MPRPQRSSGRRIAERPPSRLALLVAGFKQGRRRVLARGWTLWGGLMIAASVMALGAALGIGADWFDQAAAVTISTCYAVALSARTGGRTLVFGVLALALGLTTVLTDVDMLRTGAAVLTATVSGVLAVMVTVPAVRFRHAVREAWVAVLVAAIGAVAVIGFRPVVDLGRFDYASLALGSILAFALVYNLGAGLHGLGRRGVITVVAGSLAVAASLAYTELFRRYGAEALVNDILDGVRWMRANLGAAPRPIQMLVGVPAVVWGCHVRARRRQGWWVCAFGVTLTTSVAGLLVNPATGWLEALLIIAYSVPPGLLVGYALIRIDLALTGPRGQRARRQEEQGAMRPEPSRLKPLL